MLLQIDIKKIFIELLKREVIHIDLGGFYVTMHLLDEGSNFALSTPVYCGENFIPKSVRSCLNKKDPFRGQVNISTFLSIQEEKYQITLNHKTNTFSLNNNKIINLLEEFVWLAEKWKNYLDENDKNDLVYIFKNK